MTTLDDLIAEFGQPGFCKVDVEGFEQDVFSGLRQPIPMIYFEIHRKEIERDLEVLDILSEVVEITSANLIDATQSNWLFDTWESLEQFRDNLQLKLPPVTNAIIRMAT